MNLFITRTKLIFATSLIWMFFTLLFFFEENPLQLENILGIISLAVFPGMYTLMAIRMKRVSLWAGISMSVAVSLLELMFIALVGNFLLPKIGVLQPLAPLVLICEVTVLYIATVIVAWRVLPGWRFSIDSLIKEIFPSKRDVWFSLIPFVFVAQAVFGAFSLNNGGGDIWVLAMIAEIAVYIIYLTLSSRNLGENTIAMALSLLSLSLLFMTSMRGWFIAGHDIQNEYLMFSLAKSHGIWNIDYYRDPYNACLSITILPTLFSGLLRFSDAYIYKVLFQIFFSVVAGLTYLINRYWLKKEYAVLATIYFISFPTFFLDMPFMVRQETAFLFFASMLYIIFDKLNPQLLRRRLFLLFGFGVVISHYSTTYTVILLSLITVISYPVFSYVFMKLLSKGKFQDSALAFYLPNEFFEKQKQITLWMIVVLMLMSFVWTSLITKTGGSLTRVLVETFVAVKDGFIENNRSVDVASLLSFSKPSQQHQLEAYISEKVPLLRSDEASGTYYPTATYAGDIFNSLSDVKNPPTSISRMIGRFGVDAPHTIFIIGQIIAKMMEVLAPLGLLYVLFRRKYLNNINGEIFLLAVSSFVFVAMNIILPVLSNEYGILRALQQSLFIIGFLIVIATVVVGNMLTHLPLRVQSYLMMMPSKEEKEGLVFPLIFATAFFLYATAFPVQIFGGNTPQLHLNNTGSYYDLYYITEPKLSAVRWLIVDIHSHISSPAVSYVQADSIFEKSLIQVDGVFYSGGIFPAVIRKDAFVVIAQSTFKQGRSSIRYGGDQVFYNYPVEFLDENKDRIYDNPEVRIYK